MNEAKVQESSLKRVKTRIATFALALVVAFSMAMATPASAFAAPVTKDGVTIDKTATPLNEDDQTTVTLNVDGTQEKTVSDVVFVLDKSASTDIREEAFNMLSELREQASEGNSINVGVVNFEQGVLEKLNLTELNEANYSTIRDSVIFHDAASSGTNIYAGLLAGKTMLDNDSSVDAQNKHLVLVTDGVGYLWDSGNPGEVYSIYSENTSNEEENLYASHETIDWHHDSSSYYGEFQNMRQWYNNHASIKDDIETYQMAYDAGIYQAKDYAIEHGKGQDTDWSVIPKFAKENSYVPEELEGNTASAADAAVYKVAEEWSQIASEYNAYAYADPRYAKDNKYLWAYNAISNLGDLGDFSTALPNNSSEYDGMFDKVKSSILYAIQDGTVTGVIGNNFDLVGLDTFKLSIGGKTYPGTVSEEAGTVTFDDGKYVINYSNGSDSEQFTWKINTLVVNGSDLKLSYDLKLVNKETAAGNYTVPTNESAVLKYTSTDSGSGDLEFPVPIVTYTVEEAPVSPATPDNGNNNTNNNVNTGTVNVNTDSDGKATSLLKTSDNVLPFAAGLIALIALAGSAGAVAWRKTH